MFPFDDEDGESQCDLGDQGVDVSDFIVTLKDCPVDKASRLTHKLAMIILPETPLSQQTDLTPDYFAVKDRENKELLN